MRRPIVLVTTAVTALALPAQAALAGAGEAPGQPGPPLSGEVAAGLVAATEHLPPGRASPG